MKIYTQLSELPESIAVALYGAGEVGVAFLRLLRQQRPDIEVVCFIDSYKTGVVDRVEVISPEECGRHRFDEVIITSFAFYEQITTLLDRLEISPYATISPTFDSQAESPTILYAFYDRAVSPDGFDIVGFLVLVEAERIRRGLDVVHLVVVPASEDAVLRSGCLDREEQRRDHESSCWYEQNILIPCCWMLPSCSGVTRSSSREESRLILRYLATDYFPSGYTVDRPVPYYSWNRVVDIVGSRDFTLPLRATAKGLEYVGRWLDARVMGKKEVTITVRESIYHQDRNSRLDAWIAFADRIRAEGYFPLWVRDTEVSMDLVPRELSSESLFLEVPWNLELRMALYELAYLNMFTGSGPSVMANYNRRVCLVRFELTRSDHFDCSAEHMAEEGVPEGSPLPGSSDLQRTVWAEEEEGRIYSEFTSMVGLVEERTFVGG